MDRRTTLAIILCFLIFMGWQKLYLEPRMQKAQPQQTASQTSQPSPEAPAKRESLQGRDKPTTPSRAFEQKPLKLETGTALVGNGPKFFSGWKLNEYKTGIQADADAVSLESVTHQQGEVQLAFNDPALAYLSEVHGELKSTESGLTWTYNDKNVRMVREFRVSQGQPFVNLNLKIDFKQKAPSHAYLILTGKALEDDPEVRDSQFVFLGGEDLNREKLDDLGTVDQDFAGPLQWIATTSRYFVMALVNTDVAGTGALLQPTSETSGRLNMVYPVRGNSLQIPLKVYFGPKDLEVLREVSPTLDQTVDFGFFSFLAYPLLKIMKGFYEFFHNYGVSIIFLTLLVKLATYPLTYKSMKSMREMAKIQPQLQRIRERYKDDREALNREMMTMMKSHGYNPMAGCLPILIQMPIFFALYQVLWHSVELYQAPFMFWIQDLSAKDPYYVTPVLLSLTMFLQQKLTPSTVTDPMQQKMMQFMPVMFGLFMISLPSGLTLYMLVNAIAGIFQQMILNRKLDVQHGAAVTARAR